MKTGEKQKTFLSFLISLAPNLFDQSPKDKTQVSCVFVTHVSSFKRKKTFFFFPSSLSVCVRVMKRTLVSKLCECVETPVGWSIRYTLKSPRSPALDYLSRFTPNHTVFPSFYYYFFFFCFIRIRIKNLLKPRKAEMNTSAQESRHCFKFGAGCKIVSFNCFFFLFLFIIFSRMAPVIITPPPYTHKPVDCYR